MRFKCTLIRSESQSEKGFYAVTLAKGGPKIAKSAGDPNGLPDQTGTGRGSVKKRCLA
jgi:hypothetical protein